MEIGDGQNIFQVLLILAVSTDIKMLNSSIPHLMA